MSDTNTTYIQAGEEPGPALHHGGRARHLDMQQPQAEELRSHALETLAQLKIEMETKAHTNVRNHREGPTRAKVISHKVHRWDG